MTPSLTDREGWVLVPREPTKEMLAPFRGLNLVRDTRSRACLYYQSMISAAPPRQWTDEEIKCVLQLYEKGRQNYNLTANIAAMRAALSTLFEDPK